MPTLGLMFVFLSYAIVASTSSRIVVPDAVHQAQRMTRSVYKRGYVNISSYQKQLEAGSSAAAKQRTKARQSER